MFWMVLVLGSHLSWAIENVYTKVMVGSKIKNQYVFLVLIMALSVVVLPFVSVKYIYMPTVSIFAWLVLASILYTAGSLPYIKAMKMEEVTRINILWNTIPVFNLILGWVLIGDKISLTEFLAMFFLINGAILASLKREQSVFKFSKAFYLMILSCILYSAYAVVVRFISREISFPTIFFWTTILNAIFILVCLFNKNNRRDLVEVFKTESSGFFLLFLVVIAISNLGTFLNQWALSLKAGALVYSFEGVQVLIVFFLALGVAKLSPGFIAESFDRKNLLIKFLSFLLVAIGIVLLVV